MNAVLECWSRASYYCDYRDNYFNYTCKFIYTIKLQSYTIHVCFIFIVL